MLRIASDLGVEAYGSPTPTSPVQSDLGRRVRATVHELGALAVVHEKIYRSSVNVYASSAIADGAGKYGHIIYVRPEDFEGRMPVSADPDVHRAHIQQYLDLGFDRIYIGTRSVGVDLEELNADRVGREVLPLLRG